jgi:lipopolysaccharide transport system ATP-binding protein
MAAVKSLCTRGIVLEHGKVVFEGGIEETISKYLQGEKVDLKLKDIKRRTGNRKVLFENVKVFGAEEILTPVTGGKMTILFEIINNEILDSKDIRFDMRIEDHFGQRLAWVSSSLKEIENVNNTNQIKLTFLKNPFDKGFYFATIYLGVNNEDSDLIENAFSFEIEEGDYFLPGKKIPQAQSKLFVDFEVEYL